MCVTCGCSNDEAAAHGLQEEHAARQDQEARGSALHAAASGMPAYRHAHPGANNGHWHADGTWHRHGHDAAGTVGTSLALPVAGRAVSEASRTLRIERDILAKNDAIASLNRRRFAEQGIFAVNLVSSPGSGKTSLLVATAKALKHDMPLAVIEGDQQSSLDADRVRAAGVDAVQINTAKGCHLDAQMVADALRELQVVDDSLLLIENVGNLVCPAAFDLGEAHKVVILSVTEGDDKPLKYPDMFHAADLVIINKMDLLPHVDFDVTAAIDYARRVRPGVEAMLLSTRTGKGFDAWLAWLQRGVADATALRMQTEHT
ncbi:MAG TPA: hydrogenase nickel incorporation protein HypB [Casimicrobiaceae bacterium]|nr:hydrogenase nickel incorporation protein HypB [Casimicrobiaceae bacterium]